MGTIPRTILLHVRSRGARGPCSLRCRITPRRYHGLLAVSFRKLARLVLVVVDISRQLYHDCLSVW